MSSTVELKIALTSIRSVWYYGYHISELNFPQPSLTCSSKTSTSSILLGLPNCLDLTPALYSLATAIFTVGGLVGSLFSAMVIERTGMLGAVKLTGWINVLSSVAMTLSPHWTVLVVGRFGGGIASGLGITLVPPLLSTIAKTSHHKQISSHGGAIGILNQVAITVGIVCGQAAGLVATGVKGDKQGAWRWVVLVSGAVAMVQVAGGMWVANDAVDNRQSEDREMFDGLTAEAGGQSNDTDHPVDDGESECRCVDVNAVCSR
jgi:MFS family permease